MPRPQNTDEPLGLLQVGFSPLEWGESDGQSLLHRHSAVGQLLGQHELLHVREAAAITIFPAAQCRAPRMMTVHQLARPRRATLAAVQRALELAGVAFIDENGGGVGLRLRKPSG